MISVTADIVVFSEDDNGDAQHVLVIRREKDPFKDCWALPGGFVNEGEGLEAAALRELKEETGLKLAKCWQVGTFGDPGRDPRGHVVTVAHFATVNDRPKVVGNDDAAEAAWIDLNLALIVENNPLAFDHRRIINRAFMVYAGGSDL